MKTLYNEIMNNFKEFEDQVGVKGRYRVAQTKKEVCNSNTPSAQFYCMCFFLFAQSSKLEFDH
jgi:hypothetical protein